ncbi:hypothetical protein ERO13_1Z049689v2 [Gossypium hirsutum]|nr:hypothetical protein ERO13_1Z049689v2 [Gossypium hirsutum]
MGGSLTLSANALDFGFLGQLGSVFGFRVYGL